MILIIIYPCQLLLLEHCLSDQKIETSSLSASDDGKDLVLEAAHEGAFVSDRAEEDAGEGATVGEYEGRAAFVVLHEENLAFREVLRIILALKTNLCRAPLKVRLVPIIICIH